MSTPDPDVFPLVIRFTRLQSGGFTRLYFGGPARLQSGGLARRSLAGLIGDYLISIHRILVTIR